MGSLTRHRLRPPEPADMTNLDPIEKVAWRLRKLGTPEHIVRKHVTELRRAVERRPKPPEKESIS